MRDILRAEPLGPLQFENFYGLVSSDDVRPVGRFAFTFTNDEEPRLLRVAWADDPMRILIEWNADGSISLLEQVSMNELRDLVLMLATDTSRTLRFRGTGSDYTSPSDTAYTRHAGLSKEV